MVPSPSHEDKPTGAKFPSSDSDSPLARVGIRNEWLNQVRFPGTPLKQIIIIGRKRKNTYA